MELFDKQLTAIIIFASYNYFRNISFSWPLVHEIYLIFFHSLKSLFKKLKKYGSRGWGTEDLEFWYNSSKFYSDIYFWLSMFSNLRAAS